MVRLERLIVRDVRGMDRRFQLGPGLNICSGLVPPYRGALVCRQPGGEAAEVEVRLAPGPGTDVMLLLHDAYARLQQARRDWRVKAAEAETVAQSLAALDRQLQELGPLAGVARDWMRQMQVLESGIYDCRSRMEPGKVAIQRGMLRHLESVERLRRAGWISVVGLLLAGALAGGLLVHEAFFSLLALAAVAVWLGRTSSMLRRERLNAVRAQQQEAAAALQQAEEQLAQHQAELAGLLTLAGAATPSELRQRLAQWERVTTLREVEAQRLQQVRRQAAAAQEAVRHSETALHTLLLQNPNKKPPLPRDGGFVQHGADGQALWFMVDQRDREAMVRMAEALGVPCTVIDLENQVEG